MKIGTKELFRSWLLEVKRVSYTKYCAFATDMKKTIYKEYTGKNRKQSKSAVNVDGVTNEAILTR